MNKRSLVFIILALAVAASGAFPQAKKPQVKIVCITGVVSEFPDEFYGAEKLVREYGKAENGGLVLHDTFPEGEGSASVASRIAGFADDPSVKAIIVSGARIGTSEGFREAKTKNSRIFLVAAGPLESGLSIESSADLVIGANNAARGFILASIAKNSGLKTVIFASSERSIEYEPLELLRVSLGVACGDLGLIFALEMLPDPEKDPEKGGRAAGEAVTAWLAKYGKNALIINAEDSYAEIIIASALKEGGHYIEGSSAAVLAGFTSALGIDASADSGDPQKTLKRIETAILARGGAKRFGTWPSSYGYTTTAASIEFAKLFLEGKAKIASLPDLAKAFAKHSSGPFWSLSYSTDPETGVRSGNHILALQDTYIFGMGFFPSTALKIDPKYYRIGLQAE